MELSAEDFLWLKKKWLPAASERRSTKVKSATRNTQVTRKKKFSSTEVESQSLVTSSLDLIAQGTPLIREVQAVQALPLLPLWV